MAENSSEEAQCSLIHGQPPPKPLNLVQSEWKSQRRTLEEVWNPLSWHSALLVCSNIVALTSGAPEIQVRMWILVTIPALGTASLGGWQWNLPMDAKKMQQP